MNGIIGMFILKILVSFTTLLFISEIVTSREMNDFEVGIFLLIAVSAIGFILIIISSMIAQKENGRVGKLYYFMDIVAVILILVISVSSKYPLFGTTNISVAWWMAIVTLGFYTLLVSSLKDENR
ncbi:MAG: hypothetical protein WC656_01520 [Sulfurimonas sp.]|jgi:ABC-type antimicrobial peptide transport system permease subunit